MTDDEPRERLYDKEDGWTERKPKGVAKTIVAFANSLPDSHQAVFFIGIADKDGTIEGAAFPSRLGRASRLALVFVVDEERALHLAITSHVFSVKKPLGTEPGAVATGS